MTKNQFFGRSAIIALTLAIGGFGAFAAQNFFTDSGRAQFVVTRGSHGYLTAKTEVRFHDDIHQGRLFKTTTTSEYQSGLDGYTARTTVEALFNDKSIYDRKAWKIQEPGSDFEVVNDELIKLTEYGCCDAMDIGRLYNIQNGEKVEATLNDSNVSFSVPNTQLKARYLAIVVDSKAPTTNQAGLGYSGTVSYFDKDHVISRVRFYLPMRNGYVAELRESKPLLNPKDEIYKRRVTLWSADGIQDPKKAFNGFGLSGSLELQNGKTVTFNLIIIGDQIDLRQSIFSPEIQFDLVK